MNGPVPLYLFLALTFIVVNAVGAALFGLAALNRRLRALELADRQRRALASLFDAMGADARERAASRN